MTLQDLIESLAGFQPHLPVLAVDADKNKSEIDEIRFEGNHIEVMAPGLTVMAEDGYTDEEWLIEEIDSLITGAHWRTGKKAELRGLVEQIEKLLSDNRE